MLEDRLARAREAYVHKLAASLDELARLLQACRSGDHRALEQAQQLAHRLCGTSGTFGLTQVSEATGHIDRSLLGVLEGTYQMSDGLWRELEAALQRARQG